MNAERDPFSLEGKRVLVTGASSGIGRQIAITCSQMGASVVITGRNTERLQATFDQLDGQGHTQVVADLAVQEGIDHVVAAS
ncbi:SDR family NAD(P)-dependent oxidoreductase, partial [Xanthomonas perforans]|nr:SDR family NAD(P)-dependent oxidoreductase [Xanthomonas perforans]